jgi:hypothetical protein
MAISYVHTLGDSTLDNLFWMLEGSDLKKAEQDSMEGLLQKRLGENFLVNSLAYDGFTTKSVLNGDRVGAVLPRSGNRFSLYTQKKAQPENFVLPLEKLQQKISENPDIPHYVVLSVGGNDFRENLGTPWRLLTEIPHVQARYLQIVEKIKGLQGRDIRPILMFQYRTDANQDPYLIYSIFRVIGIAAIALQVISLTFLTTPVWIAAGKISLIAGGVIFLSGAAGLHLSRKALPFSAVKDVFFGKKISLAVFGALLHVFYQPILERAKKDKIPILDLPNTFDPHQKLYTSGIEPNKEGGELIAQGIESIIDLHYLGTNKDISDASFLYSKPPSAETYIAVPNSDPSFWKVNDAWHD